MNISSKRPVLCGTDRFPNKPLYYQPLMMNISSKRSVFCGTDRFLKTTLFQFSLIGVTNYCLIKTIGLLWFIHFVAQSNVFALRKLLMSYIKWCTLISYLWDFFLLLLPFVSNFFHNSSIFYKVVCVLFWYVVVVVVCLFVCVYVRPRKWDVEHLGRLGRMLRKCLL